MKAINQYLAIPFTALAILASPVAFADQSPAQEPVQKAERAQKPRKQGKRPVRQKMTEQERAQYKAYAEDKMQAKLNLWSRQLNITQNQQAAWNNYSRALKEMVVAPFTVSFPQRNADAATIAKFRADRAAQQAQYLADISNATSQLQAVLSAEQQAKFNELSNPWHHDPRHGDHKGPRGPRRGPGPMMHGGGWDGHMDTCPYF